jgi:hypothetical protein
VRQHGPRTHHDEGSSREVISGLNGTASTLAVYASPRGSPQRTQDSLLAAGPALPGGIRTRWVPTKGFRDVAYITSSFPKLLGAGRVSPAVSRRASHRSGRAQLRHPARLVAVSRALCCPWAFREPWIEVQSPRTVARPQFRDQAPPSLHRVLAARVPRLPRYYEALRFPTARPVAFRFLHAAVTTPCACVRRSVQVRRRLDGPGFSGLATPPKTSN